MRDDHIDIDVLDPWAACDPHTESIKLSHDRNPKWALSYENKALTPNSSSVKL
jgi:hypothetical protein